jgi:uncharacterized protein (TIGR00730 family)
MKTKMNDQHQDICVPRDIMLQAAMIRLGDINHEVQEGYKIIRKYHKTVTIFGSARTSENDKYYKKAVEVSEKLAGAGYAIISGGGLGIMGAANHGANVAAQRGAQKVGGASIGFNIKLPHEQHVNKYTTEALEFNHFAPRKIVMTMYGDAYIYFPGGFGTLDELTEVLTLIQTGKTVKAPVILFGRDFWTDFDSFVKKHLLANGLISVGDENLYTITDNVDTVVNLVKANQTYCDHHISKPAAS